MTGRRQVTICHLCDSFINTGQEREKLKGKWVHQKCAEKIYDREGDEEE